MQLSVWLQSDESIQVPPGSKVIFILNRVSIASLVPFDVGESVVQRIGSARKSRFRVDFVLQLPPIVGREMRHLAIFAEPFGGPQLQALSEPL